MKLKYIEQCAHHWANANKLSFVREVGSNRIFCYVPAKNESFQIVIEEPTGQNVTINYWEIETVDDKQFHESWTGNIDILESGLEVSLQAIRSWMHR